MYMCVFSYKNITAIKKTEFIKQKINCVDFERTMNVILPTCRTVDHKHHESPKFRLFFQTFIWFILSCSVGFGWVGAGSDSETYIIDFFLFIENFLSEHQRTFVLRHFTHRVFKFMIVTND
jgi:hypothetical protein